MNGLDFTVIMSRMRADMRVKGENPSTLSETQKGTICVDMKPLIRGIVDVNGSQSNGTKSSWAKVIFPHVQSQI
ncbi:hypothetical protein TNCV_2263431 [Trichonephila clavipes]|nr:hypothetical protein TNCV_2263431 [Trichonephila clavipes]